MAVIELVLNGGSVLSESECGMPLTALSGSGHRSKCFRLLVGLTNGQ